MMQQFVFNVGFVRKMFTMALVCGALLLGLLWLEGGAEMISSLDAGEVKGYAASVEYALQAEGREPLLARLWNGLHFAYAVPASEKNGNAGSIPVILYHGIGESTETDEHATIPLERFKEQMFALKAAGYETISIDDFRAFMRGESPLPERSFLLTFDDGRKDSYYPVDPILRALGYRATMFVITNRSIDSYNDKSDFHLNEEELRGMLASGRWDLQSHGAFDHDLHEIDEKGTRGHFLSNKMYLADVARLETDEEYRARIAQDLRASKEDLEKLTGKKVHSFAFPFSDFGDRETNYADAAHVLAGEVEKVYEYAFYQQWIGGGFSHNYPVDDPPFVKRLNVFPEWSGEDLVQTLENGAARPARYATADFSSAGEWVNSLWGAVERNDNALIVRALSETTGGSAYLDGSRLWTDYEYALQGNFAKGASISLLARFVDKSNFVTCNFQHDRVRAEAWQKNAAEPLGKVTILGEAKNTGLALGEVGVGIRVEGDAVGCFVGGVVTVSAQGIPETLQSGGIGIKVWDASLGNAELAISEVRVAQPQDVMAVIEPKPAAPITRTPTAGGGSPIIKEEPAPVRPVLGSGTGEQEIDRQDDSKENGDKKDAEDPRPEVAGDAALGLPYRKMSFGNEPDWMSGWLERWGLYEIVNNELRIGGNVSSPSSAFTNLKGSESWQNYAFNAQVRWMNGSDIYVIARYTDNDNHVACRVTGNFIRIEQIVHGERSELAKVEVSTGLRRFDFPLGVEVVGNRITCMVDGQRVTTNGLHPLIAKGGVGFKVWDSEGKTPDLRVRYALADKAQ